MRPRNGRRDRRRADRRQLDVQRQGDPAERDRREPASRRACREGLRTVRLTYGSEDRTEEPRSGAARDEEVAGDHAGRIPRLPGQGDGCGAPDHLERALAHGKWGGAHCRRRPGRGHKRREPPPISPYRFLRLQGDHRSRHRCRSIRRVRP
ncbi:MAG: hypothetical protein WC483_03815 [Candidatus Paceibacterota bacterium]